VKFRSISLLICVADAAPLEKRLAEVLSRPSSPYDSHPAPRERLALIEHIPASGYFEEDGCEAWDLIPYASQLQEEVTAQIEAQLRQQNVLAA
jgi:hypothetical protein